ncbi:hypothetical protein QFC21_000145 [Naganishia friedmannii]|uniref:Uncharacterized protein n=1 Tax=Naganishia friedmannii TaxID=89922 RepID=A0ACC2WCG1_9TREE|nr:hypothetical protein QFC21_000145 [Naganishia friedmannii]
MYSKFSLLAALIFVASLSVNTVHAFDDNAARSKSVYQVVTDRFALTNPSDSRTCDTDDMVYCGGTWKGTEEKLDYIHGMGFDTVWISPVVQNINVTNNKLGEAYHGYWTHDINELNSHFGTEADLKSLVNTAHKKGMYIMVDVVVNHVATTQAGNFTADSSYGPFNVTTRDFHSFCWVEDYTNQTQVEVCWLGDENVALADVNTEDPTIVSTYNAWIKNLVATYDFDAIRIDTVKHVRQNFWPDFVSAAGVHAVGEVLDGDPAYVAAYQNNSMSSVFNYPLYYALDSAFNSTSKTLSDVVTALNSNKQQFKDTTLLGNFISNHDNPRFESHVTDKALIKNAVATIYGVEGIPYVYYGQEQGYTGGADPANREALWLSGYEESKDMYTYFTTMNAIRSAANNASSTYNTNQATIIGQDDHNLVIRKDPVISIVTNRGSKAATSSMSITNTGFTSATELTDVISCTPYMTDSKGAFTASVKNGLPAIFLPTSQKGSLCGNVTASTTGSSSTKSAGYRDTASIALLASLMLPVVAFMAI